MHQGLHMEFYDIALESDFSKRGCFSISSPRSPILHRKSCQGLVSHLELAQALKGDSNIF